MAEKQVSVVIRAKDVTASAWKSVVGQAKGAASSIGSAISGITGLLVGGAFAGFFKGAVDESIAATRAFDQLDLALQNVGVDFRKVRPDVNGVFASLEKLAGIDDDEAAGALATLVRVSDDYQGSLKNMPLVADVAAGAHMELNAAAELVGKAMRGNTKGLKQFGIDAKDAETAVAELRRKFAGEAEREGASFEGMLKRAKTGFGNFQQAIGDVITGNQTVRAEIGRVVWAFGMLAEWIQNNADEFGHWTTVAVRGTEAVVRSLAGVVRIAFNFGSAIGNLFRALGNGALYALTYALDQAAAKTNDWLDSIDKIPGVNIPIRVDRFTAELAELKRGMADAMRAVGDDAVGAVDAVEDVAEAWANVQLASERANAEQSQAAVDEATRARRRAEALTKLQEVREKEAAAGKKNNDAEAKAFAARVEMLGQAIKLNVGAEQAVAGLRLMESALTRELVRGNLSLAERVRLAKRLADIREAMGADPEARPGTGPSEQDRIRRGAQPTFTPLSNADVAASVSEGIAGLGDVKSGGAFEALKAGLREVTKEAREASRGVDSIDAALGRAGATAIGDFAGSFGTAFEAVGAGSRTLGQAMSDAVRGAVAGAARSQGDFYRNKAVAAFGEGIFGSPRGFAAAAKFGLASAGFYALAGRLGAGGGGGSAGGSGGGGSAAEARTPVSGAAASATGTSQKKGTLIVKGGSLDMRDPRQRRELASAIRDLGDLGELTLVVQ